MPTSTAQAMTHLAQNLILGIDGGASYCKARIVDGHGNRLGEGTAGPANTRLGIDRTFTAMRSAAHAALRAAGLESEPLSRLHVGAGLAGVNVEADRQAAIDHPHPFASLIVTTDVHIACLGAFQGGDGGVLVLGTGSVGLAIVDGRASSVGGWGFQVGDQGSGAKLGCRALRQALLAHEGVIPASRLSERLLARFDNQPGQVVLWAADAKPADFGEIAPLVVELAAAGDALAIGLMNESGAEASLLGDALLARGAKRIALSGGFAPSLRPWLSDEVKASLVEPAGDAMAGAILLAQRARSDATAPAP